MIAQGSKSGSSYLAVGESLTIHSICKSSRGAPNRTHYKYSEEDPESMSPTLLQLDTLIRSVIAM
jgi:hypothetical protein